MKFISEDIVEFLQNNGANNGEQDCIITNVLRKDFMSKKEKLKSKKFSFNFNFSLLI